MRLAITRHLRENPGIYRTGLFVRRCLLPALKVAWWQLVRVTFWFAWFSVYSTQTLRERSRFYRWIASVRNGPPFLDFSVYQALRCGWPKLEGRIVLEDQGTPEVRPGSLLAEGTTKQHVTQPWPIFWSRHRQAHLVSSSLALVTKQKEVCLESVYGDRFAKFDPALQYWRLPEPLRLDGAWTSIVSKWVPGEGTPNHSHWLLEALPRLALLREFPKETRILVPARLAAYQKESLRMLGIPDERLRFTGERHLEVEDYFFSAPPTMIACYSPYAVRFLRNSFLDKADQQYAGPRRFFITRRNASRNIENNEELESLFSRLGWGVIDLAELSFAQEVKLFANAEAICGLLGSGLTNTVFCNPSCRVIALAHDYWTDGSLDWILQVVGVREYQVHMYPTDRLRRGQADIPLLKRQLQSMQLL